MSALAIESADNSNVLPGPGWSQHEPSDQPETELPVFPNPTVHLLATLGHTSESLRVKDLPNTGDDH